MNKLFSHCINFMRDAKNDSESIGEQILFFVCFLAIAAGSIAICLGIIAVTFLIPQFFIPAYLVIYLLWRAYKRL